MVSLAFVISIDILVVTVYNKFLVVEISMLCIDSTKELGKPLSMNQGYKGCHLTSLILA